MAHFHWLRDNIYITLFLATMVEGLGLPLPAELFFVVAAAVIHQGHASLGGVIFAATAGNIAGSLLGFSLAYAGGNALIRRVAGYVRIKDEAIDKVEEFFARYGAGTVFISRFVGFIRAATIYMSGAARMAPWRFVAFLAAGAFLWNALWAVLAVQFGRGLPGIMHRVMARGALTIFIVIAAALLITLSYRWLRRRPVGS